MNGEKTQDVPPFDPTDAPPGFYAVPKKDVPHDQGNLCQFCDWRQEHERDSEEGDLKLWETHHCGGYEVVTPDGRTIGRTDKTSVLYKRLPVIREA